MLCFGRYRNALEGPCSKARSFGNELSATLHFLLRKASCKEIVGVDTGCARAYLSHKRNGFDSRVKCVVRFRLENHFGFKIKRD